MIGFAFLCATCLTLTAQSRDETHRNRSTLPDVNSTQEHLQKLEHGIKRVEALIKELVPFASPLDFAEADLDQRVQKNQELLLGRAFVLSELVKAYGDSLSARSALEQDVAEYDRWLDAIEAREGGRNQPPAAANAEELQRQLREKSGRLRVLAKRRLDHLQRLADPPSETIAKLNKLVGDYSRIANRNVYDRDYHFLGEDQIGATWSQLKTEYEQLRQLYKGARAGGGLANREQFFLRKDRQQVLARSRSLIDRSKSYSDQAKLVAENAVYLADVLSELEKTEDPTDRNLTMYRRREQDKQHTVKLSQISRLPEGADDGLDDLVSIVTPLD